MVAVALAKTFTYPSAGTAQNATGPGALALLQTASIPFTERPPLKGLALTALMPAH